MENVLARGKREQDIQIIVENSSVTISNSTVNVVALDGARNESEVNQAFLSGILKGGAIQSDKFPVASQCAEELQRSKADKTLSLAGNTSTPRKRTNPQPFAMNGKNTGFSDKYHSPITEKKTFMYATNTYAAEEDEHGREFQWHQGEY